MLSVVVGCSISYMDLLNSSRTLTWWWSRVVVHLISVPMRVTILLLWIVTILRSRHELGSLPLREKELQRISILISYQMSWSYSVITQRRQAFLYSMLRMIIASDKPEKEYQYDCTNDSPLDSDSCLQRFYY